jgi:hypothetical protein
MGARVYPAHAARAARSVAFQLVDRGELPINFQRISDAALDSVDFC